MTVFLGADHRGFLLKEKLKEFLLQQGYEVIDCGATSSESTDDYVDYAKMVIDRLSKTDDSRGVLLCGSGVGMAITANKLPGIRASVISNVQQAQAARRDDDLNVLSLASDYISLEDAKQITMTFLTTPFGNEERYKRRLTKLKELELYGL